MLSLRSGEGHLIAGGRGAVPFPDGLAPSRDALEAIRSGLLAARGPGHLLGHLPPDAASVDASARAAEDLRAEGDRLVVVGIGGSALGGRALCALRPGAPVRFLCGTDPESVGRSLAEVPWERTCLDLVSKSGGTLETLTNGALCLEALRTARPADWRRRVVVTASPGMGRLQAWARSEGIRVLEIPAPVGGRFSALTPVGMIPSAFAGLDLEALGRGASKGVAGSLAETGAPNPARELGVALACGFRAGLGIVDIWAYGQLCHDLGLWLQQLWAESLGRRTEVGRVGPTPLVCRGSEDQHSLLQLAADGPPVRWALFLTADGRGPSLSEQARNFAGLPPGAQNLGVVQEALWRGTLRSLGDAGVPALRLHLGDAGEEALGEAMVVLMLSTLWAAALLGVDPSGQPGVEAGKRHTVAWLESRG